MKSCPVCRNQYTDPTLRFCLQDGASLVELEQPQSSIDTVAFSAPVTVDKIQPTAEMNFFAAPLVDESKRTRNYAPYPQPKAPPPQPVKTGSRLVWLLALPALLVCAAIGAGGWFYLESQKKSLVAETSENPAAPAVPEKNASPQPPVERQTTTADNSGVTDSMSVPTGSPDAEAIKREIGELVSAWKDAAQNRNAAEYAARYHETVDYFDQPAARLADVRAEAQKTFAAYSEIEIALSNLRVAVDADGKSATAVFDKEWDYETARDLIEGKAHVKLRFEKIGSDWKIIGEKNLKVYYTKN